MSSLPDDEDEEDLKRAIALSLESGLSSPRHANCVESADRFHTKCEDTSRTNFTNSEAGSSVHISEQKICNSEQTKERHGRGISAIDRKSMELERLARAAARKREAAISPPPLQRDEGQRPAKRARMETDGSSVAPGVIDLEQDSPETGRKVTKTDPLPNVVPSSSPGVQYPKGVVLKTWAFGHDRNRDIKIEEILQKADLKIAVLSAFQWDVEWILSKTNTKTTKFIFVMQAKDKATQEQYREETKYMPNLELCFPPMPGQVNCMHSKLMLLFHADYLRVVAPSANLVKYDWGETGVMENSVFLVDLPRLPEEQRKAVSKDSLTFFGQELIYFAEKMGLETKVIEGILHFDFSNTEHLAFVHTVGGSHLDDDMRRTGYPGLSRAVRQLGLQTNTLEVDFVASSIGSLNREFLATIYSAAGGRNPIKSDPGKAKLEDHFRVYFPTRETVMESSGGPNNAGTVCLGAKWWRSPTFPRSVFRDYLSVRAGLLSHNKILFARSVGTTSNLSTAWAYVGSANLSESAWGKVVTDKSRKAPKINCRNWECGVIMVAADAGKDNASGGLPSMDIFQGVVDVPMQFPGRKYEGRKPWFFMGDVG